MQASPRGICRRCNGRTVCALSTYSKARHVSCVVHRLLPGDEKVDSGCALIPAVIVKVGYTDYIADAVDEIGIITALRRFFCPAVWGCDCNNLCLVTAAFAGCCA